jgi:hypothetical protein
MILKIIAVCGIVAIILSIAALIGDDTKGEG